jgi:hypothetical protein
MFTKQHPETALGTTLRPMQSMKTDEATIGGKEQIRVGTGQSRQHVKGDAVNGRKDRSRETGLWKELDPMSIMIVRHHWLFYSSPSLSSLFIRLAHSRTNHYV